MIQNRFKSKAAWLTLLPVIVLFGDAYGLWNVIGMDSSIFTKVFMGLVLVAEAFGIFNNPTNSTGF